MIKLNLRRTKSLHIIFGILKKTNIALDPINIIIKFLDKRDICYKCSSYIYARNMKHDDIDLRVCNDCRKTFCKDHIFKGDMERYQYTIDEKFYCEECFSEYDLRDSDD